MFAIAGEQWTLLTSHHFFPNAMHHGAMWKYQQSIIPGKEEMPVLQKMNDILNNTTTVPVEKKKNVTFKDPIPEPRVGEVEAICSNHPRLH
jgi:hypothetical protein